MTTLADLSALYGKMLKEGRRPSILIVGEAKVSPEAQKIVGAVKKSLEAKGWTLEIGEDGIGRIEQRKPKKAKKPKKSKKPKKPKREPQLYTYEDSSGRRLPIPWLTE